MLAGDSWRLRGSVGLPFLHWRSCSLPEDLFVVEDGSVQVVPQVPVDIQRLNIRNIWSLPARATRHYVCHNAGARHTWPKPCQTQLTTTEFLCSAALCVTPTQQTPVVPRRGGVVGDILLDSAILSPALARAPLYCPWKAQETGRYWQLLLVDICTTIIQLLPPTVPYSWARLAVGLLDFIPWIP